MKICQLVKESSYILCFSSLLTIRMYYGFINKMVLMAGCIIQYLLKHCEVLKNQLEIYPCLFIIRILSKPLQEIKYSSIAQYDLMYKIQID